jgi:hypothetical protein
LFWNPEERRVLESGFRFSSVMNACEENAEFSISMIGDTAVGISALLMNYASRSSFHPGINHSFFPFFDSEQGTLLSTISPVH